MAGSKGRVGVGSLSRSCQCHRSKATKSCIDTSSEGVRPLSRNDITRSIMNPPPSRQVHDALVNFSPTVVLYMVRYTLHGAFSLAVSPLFRRVLIIHRHPYQLVTTRMNTPTTAAPIYPELSFACAPCQLVLVVSVSTQN